MFKPGDRVRIAPHTDIWMRGERYGTVTLVGRKWIAVRGERSGLLFKFRADGDALELAE